MRLIPTSTACLLALVSLMNPGCGESTSTPASDGHIHVEGDGHDHAHDTGDGHAHAEGDGHDHAPPPTAAPPQAEQGAQP